MKTLRSFPFLLALIPLGALIAEESPFPETQAREINSYWFDKAELTRYELQQMRYGEMRTGDSVLIFVTEPFLSDKQVKYEFGPGASAVPVLKLNRIRSFQTGVYDYRLMTSVFHPVAGTGPEPATLKVAMSSTEWCGLVFQQINRREEGLFVELRSYFQAEADQNLTLAPAWTEDGLWVRLRLDPSSLPAGDFAILPESSFLRLTHLNPAIHQANGTLNMKSSPASYRLYYPSLDRELIIRFEKSFPHRILGWDETVNGEIFSKGTATHSEMLYYWNRNKESDSPVRTKLGLE